MLLQGHHVHADTGGFKRLSRSRADRSHPRPRRNPLRQGHPARGCLILQREERGDAADHEPLKPPCAECLEGIVKGCLVPGPFEVLEREQEGLGAGQPQLVGEGAGTVRAARDQDALSLKRALRVPGHGTAGGRTLVPQSHAPVPAVPVRTR
jgi:hypothetical protein